MRKVLLLTGLLLASYIGFSQISESEKNSALQLVQKNRSAIGLTSEDLENSIVIHTYIIANSDVRMVYLQQSYKDIPVYNQLHVLAFRGDKLVSVAGSRVPLMDKVATVKEGKASISAEAAVMASLADSKLITQEAVTPVTISENNRKYEFGTLGVATEKISAELLWMPVEGQKEVHLVWQVFLTPLKTSDYWLVRVDASNGTIINKENLTITCNWGDGKHSVQEHIAEHHGEQTNNVDLNNFVIQKPNDNNWQYKPFVVNSATYRVVPYPAESPWAPGGSFALRTDPWLLSPAGSPATSLKWHNDGTVEHDSTRGNNVWAQEDRDNNNSTFGLAAVSTTAQPNLTFDFAPDTNQAPIIRTPVPNQQFFTTNLFYWNNIMHDLSYQYGFTEPARNFQNDNQGRGGAGVDYVIADAQDAGGTNNANFATPADGNRPRMQMYLWTLNGANPQKDGDADNGVIAHEYTHGISNRLTGTGSGCLSNAEQMGEGWSDYYALMVTHNWATAIPSDGFNVPRPIGVYALNGGGLFGPPGIRHFPYSTNMAVNPLVYTATLPTSPHDRGEIWCATLWDLTWNLIQDHGISANIFDATGTGGNVIALKLVTEGMRLQPCSPGFISGRDAILQADQIFYGGANACAIWSAFARRGMGVGASQGSSGSVNDQVPSFLNLIGYQLNVSSPVVQEGNNVTFTNNVSNPCATPITNYKVRDTLPAGVTYVSSTGGTLAGNVVTFDPVNIPAGGNQSYSVTVNVNTGTYFPPVTQINDPVSTIAPNWTAASTTTNVWTVSGVSVNSAPSAFFSPNAGVISDQTLTTTNPIVLPASPAAFTTFSFWHRYITESGFDGCVVEITTNGGATWQDLGAYMSGATYNGTISSSFGNPIGGRQAFTGNVGASFVKTTINLASFSGQTVQIRFRLASDNSVSATGWYVDDIFMESRPYVFVKSGLYDASNNILSKSDTLSEILPGGVCTDPSVTSHPASVVRCSVSGNATFTVAASGTAPTYQWQVSTNNGATWTDIGGATGTTFTIVNPTSALNGNLYRCYVSGLCGTPDTSRPAVLYVSPALTHSAVSATPATVCAGGSTAITGTAGGGTAGTNGTIGSSGVINLSIPDNLPVGINDTITLPALSIPAAANLKLRLNMTHTWVGDLKVTLTSPCGVTFAFDRPGVPPGAFGNSDNLAGVYVFDLAGATIIPETSGAGTIPAGTYQPSDASGAAHTWAGLTFPCATAGEWILNVSDNAGGDTGSLTDWAILMGGNYTHSLTGPGTIVQNAPTGANNSTGNFTVSAIPAGVQNYTLTSTDILGCTVVTTNITVTSTGAPTITTQPVNRTICEDGSTTFTLVDNTPLPPTYQWQISTNGGTTWTNLANVAPFSGVTTATLTVTGAGLVYSGNLFRCVVSNSCGTVNSNNASLTVNPKPTVNAGPSGFCAPVTITANGNANTYSWTPATGLNTTTGTTVIASPVVTTVYTVTGTITATGCQNSASVTVLGTPATPVITPPAPVICAGTIQPLTVAPTVYTFSSTGGPILIPGTGTSGPASPYPSVINVSGLPTSGVRVKSITINNVVHTFPDDIDMLVQSPTGTNVVIMSDVGGGTDNTGQNYTFDDAAASLMSDGAFNPTGAYRPTNFVTPDTWVAPGPGSVNQATPALSMFTGNFNGNWNMFIVDDLGGDAGSITSWSIQFEVPTGVWSPVTGLYSDANATIPYVAGTPASTVYFLQSPITTTAYTYTVTNTLGTCSSAPATVTVTVNPKPTISVGPNNQCSPVTLTATGNSNTYSWSPATGLNTTTGATVIANPVANTTYTVTGTITTTGCTNSATVTVNATPAAPTITPASINICLGSTTQLSVATSTGTTSSVSGPITVAIPDNNATGAFHSVPVNTIPQGATITGVSVNFNITHTWDGDLYINLTSPNGNTLNLVNRRGGSGDNFVNTTISSSSGTSLATGTAPFTGTFAADGASGVGPTAYTSNVTTFPGLYSVPNGNWTLSIRDAAGGDVGTLTSWSLSINYSLLAPTWTPITGLFTDPAAAIPYVAGTPLNTVYAKPTTTTTYTATRNTGNCTSTATSTVTVYQPITITTQPASQTVCQGANITFSVVTTGNLQTYQWQLSTNGGSTWTNITNANAASLTLPSVTTALSGNQYRVIVTNSCNTVTSNAATLTVNAPTPVTVGALPSKICISDTLIPLSGSPTGGSWSGIGVSGFSFIPTATSVGTYTLTYSYTNSFGCTSTATLTAKVEDCPERIRLLRDDAVILFPNPNNGLFNIRMNSTLYNYLGMKVYTTAGQMVYAKQFGGLVYGRVLPVDITHLPSATYLVKFYYDDGIRTSEKTFKVVVGR